MRQGHSHNLRLAAKEEDERILEGRGKILNSISTDPHEKGKTDRKRERKMDREKDCHSSGSSKSSKNPL